MIGVTMIIRPGAAKPEIHEFDGKVPPAAFRRKTLGGEGEVIPHFTTVTWDGAVCNCVAYHGTAEGQRNATAAILYKQSLARQDRKKTPRARRPSAHPLWR